jgi:hypothetical protein
MRVGAMEVVKSLGITRGGIDQKKLLRATNQEDANHMGQETKIEISRLVSRISVQSKQEVDELIEGLQEIRRKLDEEGGRLEREVRSYGAFSQSIVELANIVSEGMASIKAPNVVSEVDHVASSGERPAK